MEFGLLWYDDSTTRSIADKVTRAAAQYEHKFGQRPTVCFVNPAMLNGNPQDGNGRGKLTEIGAVQIETLRTVLPHHFLVGVETSRNGRKRKKNGQ